ncbi:FAD-dependent 5-carboxymethylaminomethyl-2-thiouridine(34) oxidoreductase MnmC [Brevundimonas sp. 2YAF1]|uniref:FAD-dependent 5-carboxymethylaminomethyl-2-thiouridine(34) oxidoreductase MnmC n=2 Tax=unclassified Brevundimonas TaxID=2622653 RepID=UPI003F90AD3C
MADELPDDVTDNASPKLFWAEDGSPRSGRFGDVYFSRDDGLAETRAVFLEGCGLPEAWAGRADFTVAELGFGTGLNIVALLDLWRRARPDHGRLHVFSIEGFPLTRDEAARALAAWPELAETAAAVLAVWPEGTPGFHRLDLPQWNVAVDLAVGDVQWALAQWSGPADAWFLDGFSPALNPGMWSAEIMALIAARSAPGARVATFTVAGAVRRGLAEQGFVVEKKPGHGRKRERLEARLPSPPPTPAPPRHVAVVGAGIAGASVARALIAGGARVTVIEADRPGAGGSGFPAALVTPRLDAGDALIAGFHAQALERARTLYRALPEAVIAEGVLQLEQAPRDAVRFDKIAAQDLWPVGAMTRLDAAACAERLGEPVQTGGLLMQSGLALRPSAVLEPWLAGAARRQATVAVVERGEDGWRLLDGDGEPIVEADAVVLTAGWGVAALAETPLSPVAGQADWVEGPTSAPTAWGGYAAPTGSGLLFGATHERGVTDVTPDDAGSAHNLSALAAARPHLAEAVARAPDRQRRKAVRATTPDRLPISGRLEHHSGLFILGGLGSRGFCVAPLLGEDLAAQILGRPSPLPQAARQRLSPARFASAECNPQAGSDA